MLPGVVPIRSAISVAVRPKGELHKTARMRSARVVITEFPARRDRINYVRSPTAGNEFPEFLHTLLNLNVRLRYETQKKGPAMLSLLNWDLGTQRITADRRSLPMSRLGSRAPRVLA